MDKIELIDRAELLEEVEAVLRNEGRYAALMHIKNLILYAPTIDAEWELFQRITDTYYDKQMFFLQDDGSVYDRMEAVYHSSTDAAIDAFIRRISEGEDDGKID